MVKAVQWALVPVAIAAVLSASTASAFRAPGAGKGKTDSAPEQQRGGEAPIDETSPYAQDEQAISNGPGLEGLVNINMADEDTLQLLPGIGPTKARAIVDFRAKKPFSDPRHLVRVKGIGRGTLHRILPFCIVQGPTTLKKTD